MITISLTIETLQKLLSNLLGGPWAPGIGNEMFKEMQIF